MEKPVTVDGPTSRKMFKLGEESVKKGLKVGVGLMCRHCENRQKLYEKVKNGDLGEINAVVEPQIGVQALAVLVDQAAEAEASPTCAPFPYRSKISAAGEKSPL